MFPPRFAAALRGALLAVILALLGPGAPAARAQNTTYLALGDSVAYGITNIYPISFGDQSYVAPFADWLGARNGGVRPHVLNLAIPGEMSTTFFNPVAPSTWPFRNAALNLNYGGSEALAQNSLMLSSFGQEQAAGRTITHVSFAVGANDVNHLVITPAFMMAATPAERAALINQTFQTVAVNYLTALTEIRTALPDAQLILPSYYNPFGIYPPGDPRYPVSQLFDQFAQRHLTLLNTIAPQFGALVVDIYHPFLGNEARYTHVQEISPRFPNGNIHPTTAGYQVIAGQMTVVSAQAEMPEPGTLTLLVGVALPGAAGALALRRRRR